MDAQLLKAALEQAHQHPLFHSLDAAQFASLGRTAKLHTLTSGESLFLQGSAATRFFLVLRGAIRLYRLTDDGRELVMNVLHEQDTVGEAVMFFDKPFYPVNATAEEKSQVLSVSNTTYKELLRASSDTCFKVMGAMACRLQQRLGEIETLTQQNASQRVARFLLDLAQEQAPEQLSPVVVLPVAKRLVAARLAMQPETFSRVIRDLRQKGVLDVHGASLTIHSLPQLRQAACLTPIP